MIRRWASIYIKWHFTWDYSFKFRARFIVLSLGDPSRRLCYWTGWDTKEIVRAALSTDSFFEVWEVIAPSVNAEYVAMSMSGLISVITHPLTDTANRTAGAVCGWINATHRLSATILPSLYDIIPLLVIHWRHQGVYPKNFSRQDAQIPRFYPAVLARGLTILLKLLPVTPNDAGADTLTD